ncbi:related to APA2-ATP adenylyltransferase II [Sporisorium reilianum SRZ2]|uniref:Related to APA2-ATP adenylyltransferase II n=1 Tax=Sporisorium reilianum (strain SRZ2) TaxID=999809 RepID=E7A2L8_SPORE|nr:related to APA2-ATP adenylyltransferase II [Sporisorium reilianum SRZ2]
MSSQPSIPDSDLKSLATEVKKKFDVAIAEGNAYFYPSEKITLQESEATGVVWQIRTVPALLKKPKANDAPSEPKPQQNESDVFAPPYVPNLLVKELGADHVVLLNKFCVVPQHFLMVTREFESQDLPPSPATLALAYRIVSAHRSSATELLAFYNCGATAGASQPHRHLQFVQCPPLDTTSDEAVSSGRLSDDEQERIVDAEHKVPVEALLERIERDGKEHDSVHALPVPWQHFVALPAPSAARMSDADMERYVGNKFMGLLDALFRARMFASTGASGRPAFNVLLTKRAMHLIPRSQEEFTRLPGKGDDGKVGNLSINALGYAGFMLTRSIEEQHALKEVEGGVEEVLRHTGVAPVEDVTVQAGLPTSNV